MTMTCSLLTSDPPLSSTYSDIELGFFDHDRAPSPSPSTSYSYTSYDEASGSEDEEGDDDDDDGDQNHRMAPHWQSYRHLIESRGYHLDTCKDVRQFYLRYWETRNIQHSIESCAGYRSACGDGRDGDDLCKDEGLVSPSFAGLISLGGDLFRCLSCL